MAGDARRPRRNAQGDDDAGLSRTPDRRTHAGHGSHCEDHAVLSRRLQTAGRDRRLLCARPDRDGGRHPPGAVRDPRPLRGRGHGQRTGAGGDHRRLPQSMEAGTQPARVPERGCAGDPRSLPRARCRIPRARLSAPLPSMTEPVVRTEQLTKRYDGLVAVRDLELTIEPGEIYGFLGPNGAGKTTTLLMVLGILKPTAGRIYLWGRPLEDDPLAVKRRVGVVGEHDYIHDHLTADEYLRFFADLYGVQRPAERIGTLLERLGLLEVPALRAWLRQEPVLEVELHAPVPHLEAQLRALPVVRGVQANGRRVVVTVTPGADHRGSISQAVAAAGGVIVGMQAHEPTLEEAFLTLTDAAVDRWTS